MLPPPQVVLPSVLGVYHSASVAQPARPLPVRSSHPAVNPSSLKVEDRAHSKGMCAPLHRPPTLFRIYKFSVWVTPSTCRRVDISDMAAHIILRYDVSPTHFVAVLLTVIVIGRK